MRPSLAVCVLQAVPIVVIAMTLASPASASTTPSTTPIPSSLDLATSQVTDPAAKMPASQPPLDLSARTVREAARAGADETNDGVVDRPPADQSKAFKELQPTCNPLAAVAVFAAVVAACATDHCGYTGSALDRPVSASSVALSRPATTGCTSKGVKLW